MKKSTRILIILLIIGVGGVLIVSGFMMGSGQLVSREASQDYAVNEVFTDLQLDTVAAQVNVVPSEQVRVTAYAKAWLDEPIDMDDVVDVHVKNGVLEIIETPFPPKFIGVFPQPYELILTLNMPQEICDAYEEDMEQ